MAYRIEKKVKDVWVSLGPPGSAGEYRSISAAEWTVRKFHEMDDRPTEYRVVPAVSVGPATAVASGN